MLDYLQHELKVFDPTLLRRTHGGKPVVMTLFERSVELVKHASVREYHPPMQIMIAAKAANGGKMHSHLWALCGFAVQLNPKVRRRRRRGRGRG